ncbi:helix-turn-helix domain-containing protein [Actinosynnema pretiosum]|nr:helix-turn-helix domain-containing protein [Actinosynnema pretiosum]
MPTDMRPLVDSHDVITLRPGTGVLLPDPAVTVVLCTVTREPFVLGPRTTATYFAGGSAVRHLLRLAPAAAAVLGLPAADLVDGSTPLRALWGDTAADAVATDPEAFAALARERGSARAEPRHAALVTAATAQLRHRTVADAARALHLGERRLREVFTAATGLPPKRYAVLDRVRRAALDRGGDRTWAARAADLGYHDQAHLAADFRAVFRIPPSAFAAARFPEPTTCRPPADPR